jgi:hypothetical protein
MDMQCTFDTLFGFFLFLWTIDCRFCQFLGAFSRLASLPIGMIESKEIFWSNCQIARPPVLQGHSPGFSLADLFTLGSHADNEPLHSRGSWKATPDSRQD